MQKKRVLQLPPPRTTAARAEHDSGVIASGDGAGPTEQEAKAAGWGGVVYAPATQARPRAQLHLAAGPVSCKPGEPDYQI